MVRKHYPVSVEADSKEVRAEQYIIQRQCRQASSLCGHLGLTGAFHLINCLQHAGCPSAAEWESLSWPLVCKKHGSKASRDQGVHWNWVPNMQIANHITANLINNVLEFLKKKLKMGIWQHKCSFEVHAKEFYDVSRNKEGDGGEGGRLHVWVVGDHLWCGTWEFHQPARFWASNNAKCISAVGLTGSCGLLITLLQWE